MKKIEGLVMGIVTVGILCSVSFADKKIYDTKCASCHGKDGKGNKAMAKPFKVAPAALDLTSSTITDKKDEELLKVISEGKNKMPAYGKQLKAEQQKSVLQYIRGLVPKK